MIERRDGLPRGIYNRLKEDDKPTGREILSEIQRCLNALISAGSFSANQMLFGCNPADMLEWDDRVADLLFTHET